MALKASTLKVGDTHKECVVENLSRTQIVQYAGASGDYNPLHSDEVYTTQVAGYPSVFAHGIADRDDNASTGPLLQMLRDELRHELDLPVVDVPMFHLRLLPGDEQVRPPQ